MYVYIVFATVVLYLFVQKRKTTDRGTQTSPMEVTTKSIQTDIWVDNRTELSIGTVSDCSDYSYLTIVHGT